MTLDLIIPALDEEGNIAALFEALRPFLEGPDDPALVRRVVLADNGSVDATPDIAAAQGAIVVHEQRRGYGSACLKALEWIAGQAEPPDVIVFLDADLSDDPASLPELIAPIERGEADLVIGSRRARAEPGALNLVQRFGNGLACALMRLGSGRRYADLGPFRAVRWATLQRMQMTDRTWGWTVEMQMKAALLDIPTVEVDVPYRRRRGGRSKISGTIRGVVTAGTKIIATILVLWWQRKRIRDGAGIGFNQVAGRGRKD